MFDAIQSKIFYCITLITPLTIYLSLYAKQPLTQMLPRLRSIFIALRASLACLYAINAAKNGKHVTVMVELKARFDEQNNIEWAKTLSNAGVKVIFGIPALKVHSKLCVIHRKEKTA